MTAYWVAVASEEHVRLGVAGSFMQVCHGKGAPLRRIAVGDYVVYYSPTRIFGGKERLQSFTAIGRVAPGEPYQFAMSEDFIPFRRDVMWATAEAAAIQPLLQRLEFTAGKPQWGYQLRFGLFAISRRDFALIARAMKAGP